MAATGTATKTGMLGTSRLAGQNPLRARASGFLGGAADTNSHIGELLGVVIAELIILAVLRKKFMKHHGG